MVSAILLLAGLIIGYFLGSSESFRNLIKRLISKSTTKEAPKKNNHKSESAKSSASKIKCKLCEDGIQTLNTGLKVECPACDGTGFKKDS